MKTSIMHLIRLLIITVIFATYGCGDKDKPSAHKEGIKEAPQDTNKEGFPLVEDITQHRDFKSWYDKTVTISKIHQEDIITLTKDPTYTYIGTTITPSEDGLLLKERLKKQTLDLETLMSKPETKGNIGIIGLFSHDTSGYSKEIECGRHIVTIASYRNNFIKSRVSIFIAYPSSKRREYPPLKDFEDTLYSEALGTMIQKYGTHILTRYNTGYIVYFNTCHIPKALIEDPNIDAQKHLGTLLNKLEEVGFQRHTRKDGSYLYYHVNLMGAPYDRHNSTVFDPETEKLDLTKWTEETKQTNSYTIFTDNKDLSPIHWIVDEINFKDRLHPDYIKFAPKKEITPFIEIVRVKTDINEDYYDVGACLHTRNGDRILLTKSLNPRDETQKRKLIQYQNEEGFKEATQTLKQVLSKLFTLEIKVNETDKLKYHRHEKYLYKFCILDEARELIPIKKAFVPSIRRYVIYTDTQRPEKIAFFATEDNKASKVEEMLNLYGMKQLTDHINEETLSKMSFVNMIGL